MSTNFQVFDENGANMSSDGDYTADTYRLNGAVTGIAPSAIHNKVLRQTSIMTAALAKFMSNLGYTVSDTSFSALVDVVTAALTPPDEVTGVGKEFWGSTLPSGYVWADGGTIGSASSGATNRANADTVALYTVLWNSTNNTNCPIQDSSGAATTRGASAAADFAANKRLPLPDKRGRASVGRDDLGGSAASRLTSNSTNGANATAIMGAGGAQTHTLTAAQIPVNLSGETDSQGAHTHTGSTNTTGAHSHTYNTRDQGEGDWAMRAAVGSIETNSTNSAGSHSHTLSINSNGAHTHTVTLTNPGGGQAHSNTQPWIACNYIIKL